METTCLHTIGQEVNIPKCSFFLLYIKVILPRDAFIHSLEMSQRTLCFGEADNKKPEDKKGLCCDVIIQGCLLSGRLF